MKIDNCDKKIINNYKKALQEKTVINDIPMKRKNCLKRVVS